MQEDRFLEVLKEHTLRYPQMSPQDYGKLIYQSEFGAKHMLGERKFVLSQIKEEFDTLPKKSMPEGIERIGTEICRYPLSALTTEGAIELCTDLFLLAANTCHGSRESLFKKISYTEQLQRMGMKEWMSNWIQRGCPSVHHSKTFRETYHPHYRLLRTEYAVYFPALLEITRLIKGDKPVLIGIDGKCGSGKSEFAKLIEKLFSCNVVHMDDFYLPPEKRRADWFEISGGNIDFGRFRKEVLLPVQAGDMIYYRPYDCQKGFTEKELPLPPRRLTVVEGSYSHHPDLRAEYDFKIFLHCMKQTQNSRLLKREGDDYPVLLERWIPMEERYFAQYRIAENSDLIVETDLI